MKEEEHLEIYGGLREEIGVETYLDDPIDYVKTLKLLCRGPGPAREKKEVCE